MTAGLDALPAVAREAIRARLEGRQPVPAVEPQGPLARRAAVFVTLKIEGELRGCMGMMEPLRDDLVAETADRAVVAAFEDPRFPPLTAEELDRCVIDVTVLGPLEPVASEDDLDAGRFGVEVSDEAGRRGVLLPAIDGVDSVENQLSIVRRKAGIAEDAPISIRRFVAERVVEQR